MRSLPENWISSPARFWRLNLIVWIIFAIFGFILRWAAQHDPGRALGLTLVQESIGFLLTGLMYFVYRRPELVDPFKLRTAALMVAMSVGAGFVQSGLAHAFVLMFGWRNPEWTEREELLFRMVYVWMIYLTWSLIFFGFRTRSLARTEKERAVQAAGEAQRMELQLLRAQLDPHFLFNSLNGIASEIKSHPDAALEMVHELSDYLRYSLEHRHTALAPLASELDAVAAYLRIEQARFGERMSATVEAEVDARRRLVPSFLLQPLVENAVKHGLQEDRCELRIFAGCDGEALTITVSNPGTFPASLEVVEGVGLETLRRRLAFHYPDRWSFELSRMNGVVTAELVLKGEPCSA